MLHSVHCCIGYTALPASCSATPWRFLTKDGVLHRKTSSACLLLPFRRKKAAPLSLFAVRTSRSLAFAASCSHVTALRFFAWPPRLSAPLARRHLYRRETLCPCSCR
ncbi:hypothetical protein PF005_g14025 [Phytophthora fragariae]|uniref:Uncharacterized protein n=1 Tax=Phytophthora fragariae TaxID=53985 RepID=A0A6A3ELU5_9STRA|nr:hypothetical protein PF003_g26177 [Phytophthora fragariae]KAE8934425.1 hypothetical protein PF009_g15605 [Phytophthora fragariae]KAE9004304.1 hypothetical protein PF011_g12509 [Phytophthora fragariae]KAE9102963.1 hypothetical protein PF010_g13922 [Phytophthora fragariae]KAE9104351.1 hypothetical protein PF007_g14083 [Phytophthora fragariae]